MKTLIANTQSGVKQRVANREELIRTRIEKLLDMPEAGEIGFKITDIEKKPDGTSIAKVTLFRHERGTRMATVLEIVKEQRVRTVDGQEQTFTVEVPKKRMVKQFAMKKVPVREEDVPIPAGADAEETVKNFVDKKVSTEVDF